MIHNGPQPKSQPMTPTQPVLPPSRPVPPPIRPRPHRAPRPSPPKPLRRSHKPHRRLPVRREVSAGGVVARREGDQWLVALLKTEHKRGLVWVLPKGHVEHVAQEKISEAARREVEEEAGVRDASVKEQLGVTRFRFQAENAVVAKTVHYFLMTTQQKQLTPQIEEGLLEAIWAPIEQAVTMLAYDTDQDIVRRAYERLTGRRLPAPASPPRSTSMSRRGSRRPPSHRSAHSRQPRIHS